MSTQDTKKAPARMPEFLRKLVVGLKRRPSIIPLLVLILAFVYYSLNLTQVSNTTAKIQGAGMGLCGFATMLFSMLSLMCFINAFPRRKKPVIPMIVLMCIMFVIILWCDNYYMVSIYQALTRADNPIYLDSSTMYIVKAFNMLQTHKTIELAGVIITALIPVYTKLLGRINTSIVVEDNGRLGAIDISGEE